MSHVVEHASRQPPASPSPTEEGKVRPAEARHRGSGAARESSLAPAGFLSEIFVSFQGEGLHVGRRQLFLRMGGCNIRCRYCDTPDGLERHPTFRLHANGREKELSNPVTPAELGTVLVPLLTAEALDGVSLTGGEPLLQADFLAGLLRSTELPRPRLLETNGVLPERLQKVLPYLDVVSMDIKLPSNSGEPGFWPEHGRFLALARGKVYVKILVDAGTDEAEVERAAQLVAGTAPDTPAYLQPIERGGAFDLDRERLERFFRCVRRHLADVRVVPQIHKLLAIP